MTYLSPIPLIVHSGFDKTKLDDNTLQKIEQRLLEDVARGGGKLLIRNQVFSKETILKLIGELRNPDTLQFHFWIFENSVLRDLLEKNVILYRPATLYDIRIREDDQFGNFKRFISPYLVHPFSTGVSKNIDELDFAMARRFLMARELMVDADQEEAFVRIKSALTSFIDALIRIKEDQLPFDAREFAFVENQFIDFLNDLPDSFQGYRDKIAVAFIDLSVVYQYAAHSFFQGMYFHLGRLNCSPGVMATVNGNVGVAKREVEEETKSRRYPYIAAVLLALTIFSIYSIANRCEERRANDEYFSQVKQIVPSEARQYHLQRILGELAASQISPNTVDSMWRIISKSAEDPAATWPYPSQFQRLENYIPSAGVTVSIANESQYDVVIFVRNQSNRYARILRKTESIEALLANHDRISFYLGSDWRKDFSFQIPDPLEGRIYVNGVFAKVDSTTIEYLNRHYQLACDADCMSVDIKLTSFGKRGFNLELHGFEIKEDIFYWD